MNEINNRVARAAARNQALTRIGAVSRRIAAMTDRYGVDHETVQQRRLLLERWELEARAYGATDTEVESAKNRAPILLGQS
ncbi:hypothetical protein QNA23_10675 [Rhodococcus erythropolis]|uniref:hypothetical protein n=1 Tax=Rhodococcus erythropolis TaxID=1833 RepID=UPI0024BBDFCB|nr:hypothetical protein [Rhodococcus erythropolis]MDJ0403946.1 hypothetical protein [Rhodococcus erythropolis]